MKTMRQVVLFGFMLGLLELLWQMPAHAVLVSPSEVLQLEFTGGAANWGGTRGRILDRLLDQGGTLTMGHYQSWADISDPIRQGHKTYSLFTSGFLGGPAPSATIEGMSITMDLSSLFLGWQRGDEIHAWNIGGTAKGLFNPQTSEFQLSWDHLFNGQKHDRMRDNIGTFFLQGTAVVGAPAAVPIPATGWMFLTGVGLLVGLLVLSRTSGIRPAPASLA